MSLISKMKKSPKKGEEEKNENDFRRSTGSPEEQTVERELDYVRVTPSLISKMKKSAKKAEEEKKEMEFRRHTGSQQGHSVEGALQYVEGRVSNFQGNVRTAEVRGVSSRFFQQGGANERSQGVIGVPSSSQERPTITKQPNLNRLRTNTSSTFVPTTLGNSSSLRSNIHSTSLSRQREALAANSPCTSILALPSNSQELITRRSDLPTTSLNMDSLNIGNVIGNFWGGTPLVDNERSEALVQRPLRQPIDLERRLAALKQLPGRIETYCGGEASSSGLFNQPPLSIVQRQPQSSDLQRQLAYDRQIRGRQERVTAGQASPSNALIRQPQLPIVHREAQLTDSQRQLAHDRQLRGSRETFTGLYNNVIKAPTLSMVQSHSQRSVHPSSTMFAYFNNPSISEEDRQWAWEIAEHEKEVKLLRGESLEPEVVSAEDLAKSAAKSAIRAQEVVREMVKKQYEKDKLKEKKRIEKEKLQIQKQEQKKQHELQKQEEKQQRELQKQQLQIEKQQRRELEKVQVQQGQIEQREVPDSQLQIVDRPRTGLTTLGIIDIFRRKRSEEDPDDKRKRLERERKQRWREVNENRLVEASAAVLRRKQETPEQTEERLALQAVATVNRRDQQTIAEREQRLALQAVATVNRRDNETIAEREQRLALQAVATVNRRDNETIAEREQRLALQAVATVNRRDNETIAEREQRLALQAVATVNRRDNETIAEREQRLALQAVATVNRRDNETIAEREQRLALQAVATVNRRDNESVDQRRERLDKNAAAMRGRRGAEINQRIQEIQRVQRLLRDNNDEKAITKQHCGTMSVICPFCNSWNFPGENTGFTKCCRKGKLIIPVVNGEEYPQLLEEMMSDNTHPDYKNFREHIRNYNSCVSFASMGAENVKAPNHGPYCFKVHGSVYHKTSHVIPVGGNAPQYAQLYILDRATQVVETAIQHPSNVNNIVGRILYKIVKFMREHNRLAATFRMMADVLKAEEEKAKRDNVPVTVINMVMRRNREHDARRYNLPLENEVAMIFVGENVGEPPFERDIQIYPKNPRDPNHHFIKLNILSANLDPMVYSIMYPFGQSGWCAGLEINGFRPSMLQYKQAQLAIRGTFNPIISAGRLTQQWIVDSYLQVEANNLNYIRQNQKRLRAEEYSGLRDYVNRRANEAGLRAGQPIILPSTFEGSPRNMRERLQDAMAIFAKFGSVDAFVTFTANPAWAEIVENLKPGEISSDRPDLIARVFKLKLDALIEDITVNHVLGRQVAWVYTIEFQKRGLPHAHILVVFAEADKFKRVDRIDETVSAEIPDVNLTPELYNIVVRQMMHGPCGTRHPHAACMEDGKCSKDFPKVFQPETLLNTSGTGYGLYRRPDNGRGLMKSGTWMDNRWVVPYNKFLLLKYNAHINVEVCTSMRAVKYIYKYIYKGFDCANFAIGPGDRQDRDIIFDEINNFIDARYISAPEGMWRLLENQMHGRGIAVIHLTVHLPEQQKVFYQEGTEEEALARAALRNTMLTAWFTLNEMDPNARQYRYTQIPEHYTFAGGIWQPRQRGTILPRIYSVSPSKQELFHLRLLLLHVPGATSFEYLRTVNGVVYPTFKEGALHRQLLSDDTEWRKCMQEAAASKMPPQMRQTLAFIFIFCKPSEPARLFNDFLDDLIMDFTNRGAHDKAASINLALHDIESILKLHGAKCTDFGFPEPRGTIEEARNYDVLEERENAERLIPTLNPEQRRAFDKIVEGMEQPENGEKQRLFFLNGPGGSGKTYLYNALISYVRGQGKSILSHATTGIAATLIKGGTTVHSGFGLPINIEETSTSRIKLNSPQGQALLAAIALIIDEVTMATGDGLRIIEELLRCEIMRNNKPFGGKIVILGGDWRQGLPVILGARRVTIIEACLISSKLYKKFEILSLISNMRSAGRNAYNEWLLDIGKGATGAIDGLSNSAVLIPDILITQDDIVEKTFGGNITGLSTDELSKRVILNSTNKEALEINNKIIAKLPGDMKYYYSSDSIDCQDKDDINEYSDEFLHEIQLSGLPPHGLCLKKGAIVMLLRNLNRKNGLCNGTRLVVKDLKDTYIHCEILSEFHKGDQVFLSRLDLTPSQTNLPFQLRRRQFPIIPSFAMTINKSQGQSFDKVGIHLNDPVFAHGQLYVALSRCRDPSQIAVFLNEGPKQGRLLDDGHYYTENIVYREVFKNMA